MDAVLTELKRRAAMQPSAPGLMPQLLHRALMVADEPQRLSLPARVPSLAIVCCSIKPDIEARFRAEVSRVFSGWSELEVVVLNDAASLAEAYNRGGARTTGEWLIFCHDDIRFLRDDFAARVADAMTMFDVFGPAGSTRAIGPAALWGGPASGRAQVSYPMPDGRCFAAIAGVGRARERGELLDGLFIAARRRAFESVRFDADRFDGFHLYDMDFSYGCHRAGWRVGIAQDLLLLHDSGGNFDERWAAYAERFAEKYQLAVVEPHPQPSQGIPVADWTRIAAMFDAINAA